MKTTAERTIDTGLRCAIGLLFLVLLLVAYDLRRATGTGAPATSFWLLWSAVVLGFVCTLFVRQKVIDELAARQKDAAHLTQAEEGFLKAFVKNPIPMMIVQINGRRIRDVNESYVKLSGYRREELLSLTPPDPADALDPATSQEIYQTLLAAGSVTSLEARLRGKSRTMGVIVSAEKITFDHEACALISVQDITDCTKAENALRLGEREAWLRAVIEAAPNGIIIVDEDGTITLINARIERVFGYTRDELIGQSIDLLLPDRFRGGQPRQRAESAGFSRLGFSGEVRECYGMHKNGHAVPLEIGMTSIRTSTGMLMVGSVADITLRKEAEMLLRDREEWLRLVIESVPNAIIICDEQGTISLVNDQLESIFGYSKNELIGRKIELLVPEKHRHSHPHLRESFAGRFEIRQMKSARVICGRRRDGTEVPVEIRLTPIRTAQGLVILSSVIDISERMRIEEELKRARDTALEMAHLKSEFLANMSHEIRTPMYGVIGLTDLLIETELTPEQRECLDVIRMSGDLLLNVINDILDFSKIEAGKLALEALDFDLRQILERLLRVFTERARQKSIDLRLELDPDLPCALRGDFNRFQQVLTNLIGNAIKFTFEGEVVVGLCMLEQTDERVVVKVEVRDTGIGIAQENLPVLFEAFRQADGSTARKFGGTGLGLAICARLIDLMGGRMGVESEIGRGSRFWFTLSLEKQRVGREIAAALPGDFSSASPDKSKPNRMTMSSNEKQGMRILVVDDSEPNRIVTRRQIESLGFSVETVESGQEALDAIEQKEYALILMDCQMPVMDGLATTAAIRARDGSDRHTRIVALTANAMAGERARCLQLGMDDYLTKPIRLEQLATALDRLLGPTAAGHCQSEPAPPSTEVILDRRMLDEMRALQVEGESDVLAEVIRAYLSSASPRFAIIRSAIEEGDAENVRLQAHTLKGASHLIGASHLGGLCRRMEELAEEQTLTPAQALLDSMEEAFFLVRQSLEFELQRDPAVEKTRDNPGDLLCGLKDGARMEGYGSNPCSNIKGVL